MLLYWRDASLNTHICCIGGMHLSIHKPLSHPRAVLSASFLPSLVTDGAPGSTYSVDFECGCGVFYLISLISIFYLS